MRDARKPIRPIAVEEDDRSIVMMNGEERAAARLVFAQEDIERMKSGYACARCFEATEEAFPKECRVCKFPMREKQSEFIAKAYQGTARMGPSTTIEDELAAMEYLEEKQKREKEISRPQILMPGKDF